MIRCNLMGALGNQMFEYAYARALSEKFNDKKIEINPYYSLYENLAAKRIAITPNSLNNLCLNENVKEMGKLKGLFAGLIRFVDFVFHDTRFSRQPASLEKFETRSKKGIYQIAGWTMWTYYQCSDITKKNKHVTGYFQNGSYFKDIRQILLREFQVKTKPSRQNALKIEELKSCNSVCVHVRRGDYLNPQFSYLNICNEKYYQRGMDYVEQHTKNPVFYIFSNSKEELKWIRENYHFKQKVKYVDFNNPDYEELRLMYNCKHFVISNSTFSWWGSYLAQNKDKIVAAPSIWKKDEGRWKNVEMGIYRDDMVKIPVD